MTALISHRNYYLLHRYLYYTSQHPNTLLLSCSICDPKDKAMGWVKAVLVFVVLQSVITSLPHRAAAGDLLSPFFSTYSHVSKISGLTDAFHFYSLISLPSRDQFHGFSRFVIQMRYATAAWSVGRGAVKCRRTTPLVSYASAIPGGLSSILETTSGSSPASFPIVSSINYSCSNGSSAPAASPSPHPTNVSKLDPLSSVRTALLFSSLSILSKSLLVLLLWSGHLCEHVNLRVSLRVQRGFQQSSQHDHFPLLQRL
ncbi:hypothetical protein BHE74_00039031 [Ensete ventricosum]|nr:hypothetical protein BHE74_00039031 [Ensete ventricosum]